jgi:hypothetical protein
MTDVDWLTRVFDQLRSGPVNVSLLSSLEVAINIQSGDTVAIASGGTIPVSIVSSPNLSISSGFITVGSGTINIGSSIAGFLPVSIVSSPNLSVASGNIFVVSAGNLNQYPIPANQFSNAVTLLGTSNSLVMLSAAAFRALTMDAATSNLGVIFWGPGAGATDPGTAGVNHPLSAGETYESEVLNAPVWMRAPTSGDSVVFLWLGR